MSLPSQLPPPAVPAAPGQLGASYASTFAWPQHPAACKTAGALPQRVAVPPFGAATSDMDSARSARSVDLAAQPAAAERAAGGWWPGKPPALSGSVFSQSATPRVVEHLHDEAAIQHELREATYSQRKVRYFAAFAPALCSKLRDDEEHLQLATLGMWRFATASAVRARAVDRFRITERAANVKQLAGWLAGERWPRLALSFAAWRRSTTNGAWMTRAVQRFALATSRGATFLIIRHWSSATKAARASRSAEASAAQRMELRLRHLEAGHETAALGVDSDVAMASMRTLGAASAKAHDALSLILRSPLAADVSASVAVEPLADSSAMETIEATTAAYEDVVGSLAIVRKQLASILGRAAEAQAGAAVGATAGQGGDEEERRRTRLSHGRDALRTIPQLRAECARLYKEIDAARDASLETPEVLAELARERARTEQMGRKLAEAREGVTSLRARHKEALREAEAEDDAGAEGAGADSLPEVQRALCELARVSEELLVSGAY